MASTTLADYQVLSDANFTLDTAQSADPSSKVLKFSFPSDFHNSQSESRRPILAFKIRPFSDTDLTVLLDERVILDTSFDKSHTRAYWEAFSTAKFTRFHNDSGVRFQLTEGKARFGDVVIWYQINR